MVSVPISPIFALLALSGAFLALRTFLSFLASFACFAFLVPVLVDELVKKAAILPFTFLAI